MWAHQRFHNRKKGRPPPATSVTLYNHHATWSCTSRELEKEPERLSRLESSSLSGSLWVSQIILRFSRWEPKPPFPFLVACHTAPPKRGKTGPVWGEGMNWDWNSRVDIWAKDLAGVGAQTFSRYQKKGCPPHPATGHGHGARVAKKLRQSQISTGLLWYLGPCPGNNLSWSKD